MALTEVKTAYAVGSHAKRARATIWNVSCFAHTAIGAESASRKGAHNGDRVFLGPTWLRMSNEMFPVMLMVTMMSQLMVMVSMMTTEMLPVMITVGQQARLIRSGDC